MLNNLTFENKNKTSIRFGKKKKKNRCVFCKSIKLKTKIPNNKIPKQNCFCILCISMYNLLLRCNDTGPKQRTIYANNNKT